LTKRTIISVLTVLSAALWIAVSLLNLAFAGHQIVHGNMGSGLFLIAIYALPPLVILAVATALPVYLRRNGRDTAALVAAALSLLLSLPVAGFEIFIASERL
jgi:hypothetical protein